MISVLVRMSWAQLHQRAVLNETETQKGSFFDAHANWRQGSSQFVYCEANQMVYTLITTMEIVIQNNSKSE